MKDTTSFTNKELKNLIENIRKERDEEKEDEWKWKISEYYDKGYNDGYRKGKIVIIKDVRERLNNSLNDIENY